MSEKVYTRLFWSFFVPFHQRRSLAIKMNWFGFTSSRWQKVDTIVLDNRHDAATAAWQAWRVAGGRGDGCGSRMSSHSCMLQVQVAVGCHGAGIGVRLVQALDWLVQKVLQKCQKEEIFSQKHSKVESLIFEVMNSTNWHSNLHSSSSFKTVFFVLKQ